MRNGEKLCCLWSTRQKHAGNSADTSCPCLWLGHITGAYAVRFAHQNARLCLALRIRPSRYMKLQAMRNAKRTEG